MIERVLKSVFLRDKPVHLILHATGRCPLRCRTCFVDFERYRGTELTLSEIKDISKYLGEFLWLDLSGGEPFLRKDLPEICESFRVMSLSIPTNGFDPTLIYNTTKGILKKTNASVNIAVSLDGFEETNDSIRAEGCFKKSIKTLEMLKSIEGLRVKVNTVLCEKNYGEIIDFMRFIRTFNPDFHSIILLRGVPRDPLLKPPSYKKLVEIKDDIFSMWNTYTYGFRGIETHILRNYQKVMYETSLRVIREKTQMPKCVAGSRHLVVYPNGDVVFCEMLKPFGNLRKERIEVLLNSKKAERQRRSISEGACFCHHNCNMIDNFFLNPLQYPKLLGI